MKTSDIIAGLIFLAVWCGMLLWLTLEAGIQWAASN